MKQALRATPSAVRAVGTGTALTALAASVAFLSNILMSHELGPTARGQVAFVLQLAYFVAPIVMLGVDRTLLRADAVEDGLTSRRHLLPVSLILTGLLLAVFQDWRALAGPVAYVTCWLALSRSSSYRLHQFKEYATLTVLYQGLILISVIGLYLLSAQSWLLWLLPYAAPALILALIDLMRDHRRRISRTFTGVNAISLRLVPMSVATNVILRADRILMPFLSTEAQLGIYIAVATATEALTWIATALADHRVARLKETDGNVRGVLRMMTRDFFFFTVASGLVGLAIAYVLLPFLGDAYLPGKALVVPLCFAAVAFSLLRQATAWILAGSHPTMATTVACWTAAIAVPVYVIAIDRAGALGAAWASLGAYCAGLAFSIVAVILHGRRERASAE